MLGEHLGKWRIFRELGKGGMGAVYLAQEELTGREAALKVLDPTLAQDAGFRERFQREIGALALLEHPGIVRFYESGFENGHHYYAMELVEGQSLEDYVHERNRIPWAEVIDIARQICPALKHVHDHGIIHRDLKPSNLLRTVDGKIKVTDFGIARVFAAPHLTATGGIVGSAEFLSPEQAAGKVVGKRSDIYSLGCVLYALLTGRTPFQGHSMLDLIHKHRYSQPEKPSRLVPGLPYEVDELVMNLLDKEPSNRPADCLVLSKQLEQLSKRLERKHHVTNAGMMPTVIENPRQLEPGEPGEATLMRNLMREELNRLNHGGPISSFFQRPGVIILLFLSCLAIFAWTFWPLGPDQLFDRGKELMERDHLVYWERAWREYLTPLDDRFPDHPYKKELAEFRKKVEAGRGSDGGEAGEAKRLFELGQRYRQEGDFARAQTVWQSLIVVFANDEADQRWVDMARRDLDDLARVANNPERFRSAKLALDRAAHLRDAGNREAAETIWNALETLYRSDLGAGMLMIEIARARKGL